MMAERLERDLSDLGAPRASPKSHIENGRVVPGPRRNTMVSSRSKDREERRTPKRLGPGGVELIPQPHSSPADPLNWPQWRKECTYASLIFGVALLCIVKTMFVTVNAVIAAQFNVSYGAAAALTGVPYILGGLAALKGHVLNRFWGKRVLYLISSITILLAMLWNMHITSNYGVFMVSRIFQGLGWGVFEALVAGSISDIFFVHERKTRMNILNAVTILSTWGFPVFGGYLSQNSEGFARQIMIINIVQAFSILFLIVVTPETAFDRSSVSQTTFPTHVTYLSSLRLITPESRQPFSTSLALRPLRALCAPSSILTALLAAPLLGTALGLANTISLLFSAMPTFLFPSHIGFLFILPSLFSLLAFSTLTYITYFLSKPPRHLSGSSDLGTSVFGLVLGIVGLFSFGFYTMNNLLPQTELPDAEFILEVPSADLNLNAVSALFGLLVAGALILYYSSLSHLSSSSTPFSPLATELDNATKIWTEVLVGIWIIGVPMWVEGSNGMLVGLKDTSIALGVVCLVLTSTVAAAMWAKGKELGAVDCRVLRMGGEENGEVPLQRCMSQGSFYEA